MTIELGVLLVLTGGSVALYGRAFRARLRLWRHFHDPRGREEVLITLALLLTSTSAAASVVLSRIIPLGSPPRSIVGLFAWGSIGAFLVTALLVNEAWGSDRTKP
jgi:hypothetical protein